MKSIVNQKIKPDEIIIIDDGSKKIGYIDKINQYRFFIKNIIFYKKKMEDHQLLEILG